MTSGQTWWKNMGDFFIVINLQNSQWNSKEELSFCFNIGVALTGKLSDKDRKKATYHDVATQLREDSYLSEDRVNHKYRQSGWLGYLITDKTDLTDFIDEFKIDFEENILPTLGKLLTLKDCVDFYSKFDFWSLVLNRQIKELNLSIGP